MLLWKHFASPLHCSYAFCQTNFIERTSPQVFEIEGIIFLVDSFLYVSNVLNVLNNFRYLSERETADRNFALGYYMRECKVRDSPNRFKVTFRRRNTF